MLVGESATINSPYMEQTHPGCIPTLCPVTGSRPTLARTKMYVNEDEDTFMIIVPM